MSFESPGRIIKIFPTGVIAGSTRHICPETVPDATDVWIVTVGESVCLIIGMIAGFVITIVSFYITGRSMRKGRR